MAKVINAYRGYTAATAITTSNIASQSVSYATSAGGVTHAASRTDSTYYNVGWFSGSSSPAYSCDTVQIQSSTGTLKATTLKATGDIIAYAT